MDFLFINEGQKNKTKFGKVGINANSKEFVEERNFKPTFLKEVLSSEFYFLNIKKMLNSAKPIFTFRYEQLLRKSKFLLRSRL